MFDLSKFITSVDSCVANTYQYIKEFQRKIEELFKYTSWVSFVARIRKNWVFSNTLTKDQTINRLPKKYAQISSLLKKKVFYSVYSNMNSTD